MCGIAGIVDFKDHAINPNLCDNISNIIEHRGPDDKGFLSFSSGHLTLDSSPHSLPPSPLVLIHRRLAILDVTHAGWQPMLSEDKRYAITYNGEIYNFVELKKELEALGYKFSNHTDTEVLLYSYIHWGKACLNKFVGMFAFSILDTKENILFCARDFFGIKPFYYSEEGDKFSFASEIKALLQLPWVHRRVNSSMAYDFLASSMNEGTKRSFFENIHQLPPAHYLIVDLSAKKINGPVRYWRIEDKTYNGSFSDAKEELYDKFKESVRIHLRSDVPLAANLSGGIDSSSIVMMAKNILQGGYDIKTISFISEEEKTSEERWIDIINQASGSTPCKIKPTSSELTDSLDRLIYTQDEPFGSSSPFAQYGVFNAIHNEGIKVVLDGQGADELLAGYRSYVFAYLASLLKNKRYMRGLVFAVNASRLPGLFTWSRILKASRQISLLSRNKRLAQTDLVQTGPEWLNSDWFKSHKVYGSNSWFGTSSELMKEQLKYTFEESSLAHLLRVADRNSMAFSVESRLPFLTPDLTQFIFSLPEDYIMSINAVTKNIFRKSMEGLVPGEILSRKDKIGFTTPEQKWLLESSDWVESILNSEQAQLIPMINQKAMLAEWRKFSSGGSYFDWRFWRWINFIRWTDFFKVDFIG